MQQKYVLLSVALAIVILVFVSFIASTLFKSYAFEFESQDIQFVSNYKHPGEFLKEAASQGSFIVSPQFAETGSTSFMAESLTLFNSVLIAKGKVAITVARVAGPDKALLYCQTNDGNVLVNDRIESPECLSRLEYPQSIIFFVNLPDPSLSKSTVEVKPNQVIITPRDFSEVSRVSFVVLTAVFPDTPQIIDQVNGVLDRIEN